jgi:hypothetical protein
MTMAKFIAISEADIVGSEDSLPAPGIVAVPGSTNALLVFTPPVSPTEYSIYNLDAPGFPPTASITSFAKFTVIPPFAVGAGSVDHVWRAESGDDYLLGTFAPSDDTLLGLLAPKVGDPTKTHGTEQQFNQFFFQFEDKIRGSDEDDKLCGWEEDDSLWGDEGDDEFYYGEGMGKDKILDFNKNDDEVIFDEDLVDGFNQLKKDANLKNDKIVVKFDSSDKLTIYGIETLKELKNASAFDDFTDFS